MQRAARALTLCSIMFLYPLAFSLSIFTVVISHVALVCVVLMQRDNLRIIVRDVSKIVFVIDTYEIFVLLEFLVPHKNMVRARIEDLIFFP